MTSKNKKIAKNTIFLYIRKIITLALALYTSRVLLQTLGLDDYGLYGLVGSIVILFNSLRGLFATSIQRFLNMEKDGDEERQNKIFSTGVSINVWIAIIFTIVVEISGFILIPNLNLQPEKISIAYWVLQFSILSSIVSILTVPYDALMIANERFDAIAAFSLLDSFLRLGVIYLLVLSDFNRVILYSILLFLVALLIRLLNAIYCKNQFPKISKYKYCKDKSLLKMMTKFAGWNFLGNMGFSITNQGLNFVLNAFGGLVANAARTITYQVNNNIRSFIGDLTIAFTPQSMMSFKNDKQRFYHLQFFSAKASTTIYLMFVFPVFILTQPMLQIWLGSCPPYSVEFIHSIIFYSLVRTWHSPLDTAFKSANKMKIYQICEISISIMNLPVSYIILKMGAPLYSLFLTMAILEFINLIIIMFIAKKQLQYPVKVYCNKVIMPAIAATSILSIFTILFISIDMTSDNLIKIILLSAMFAFISLSTSFCVIFNNKDRKTILNILKIKN